MRPELVDIDVAGMRGLEIGPLASPVVLKNEGQIRYLDHANTEELRKKYSTDQLMKDRLDEIVEVDYVLNGATKVFDVVEPDAPFDYVIASHLIEHMPDPVGWLADISRILRPGGILSLVVPDKRYTFDINRTPTEISEIVDSYLRQLSQPSYKQFYDFFAKAISGTVDTAAVWAGTANYQSVVRADCADPDVAALDACRTLLQSGEFVDAHCQVFTPDSFLNIFESLARLGLIDFSISNFIPTEINHLEFYVSLNRLQKLGSPGTQLDEQLRSVERARVALEKGPQPVLANEQPDLKDNHERNGGNLSLCSAPKSGFHMAVSERERKVLTMKREWLRRVRNTLRAISS